MTSRFSPKSATPNQTVNGERLWQSLMDLGKIGGTPAGGVHRLALTDLDRQARDLFIQWAKEAGCTVRIDPIGNIFARREGRNPSKKAVVTGSHIDTQPPGGKFDGCYGVMAGLEVLRTLNDFDIQTEAPIEVVVWTNEEGSRFPPCMMGSGVFIKRFGLEDTLNKLDEDGITVKDALQAIDYAGSDDVDPHSIGAYFEAHIEQGPVLEAEEKTIGVVLGALGQKWFDLTLLGVEAHAGPTPMNRRQDALLGAAEIIQAVNAIALDHAPHGRGTVGWATISPNSRNVIPGTVRVSIDFRHLQADALDSMVQAFHGILARVTEKHGLTSELVPTADFPPLEFTPALVDGVRQGAAAYGYSHMDIVSGAGHDAIFLAEVAPAAMIFVPCEDGISHNEKEHAEPADLEAGCNVLLSAMLNAAGIAV